MMAPHEAGFIKNNHKIITQKMKKDRKKKSGQVKIL